jgi:hypothetical protein
MIVARKHRVKPLARYRLRTNVQARRFAVKPFARFVNRHASQPAFLIGSGVFLPATALDSVPSRAQHHSYTNDEQTAKTRSADTA